MINEETIKSLYNDKPTLLEWLKRVEAQLEELKKITNFDTLTANSLEVKEDASVGGLLYGHEANFEDGVSFQNGASVRGDFNVNGKSVCRNIYVHRISWKYVTNAANVFKFYLSTKPTPYSSKADVFSHRNDTSLSTSELIEYGGQSAIVKFSPTGAVLNAVAIGATSGGGVDALAMDPNAFDFVKDEVIGGWGV